MSGYTGQVPDSAARPLDWQEHAVCRDDADMFFDRAREHDARTTCVVRCPVRAACLAHVKDREEGMSEHSRDDGIFAGLDRRQRWRLDPSAPGKEQEGGEEPAQTDPRCGTAAALEQHLALGADIDPTCWSGEVRRVHTKLSWRRRNSYETQPEPLNRAS